MFTCRTCIIFGIPLFVINSVNSIKTRFKVKVTTVDTRILHEFFGSLIRELPHEPFVTRSPLILTKLLNKIHLFPMSQTFLALIRVSPSTCLVKIVFSFNNLTRLFPISMVLVIFTFALNFFHMLMDFWILTSLFITFLTLIPTDPAL